MNPLYFLFPEIFTFATAPGTLIPGEPNVNPKSSFVIICGFEDGKPCKTPSKSQLPAPEEYAQTSWFPIDVKIIVIANDNENSNQRLRGRRNATMMASFFFFLLLLFVFFLLPSG
jgi:hypothetical protein